MSPWCLLGVYVYLFYRFSIKFHRTTDEQIQGSARLIASRQSLILRVTLDL